MESEVNINRPSSRKGDNFFFFKAVLQFCNTLILVNEMSRITELGYKDKCQ